MKLWGGLQWESCGCCARSLIATSIHPSAKLQLTAAPKLHWGSSWKGKIPTKKIPKKRSPQNKIPTKKDPQLLRKPFSWKESCQVLLPVSVESSIGRSWLALISQHFPPTFLICKYQVAESILPAGIDFTVHFKLSLNRIWQKYVSNDFSWWPFKIVIFPRHFFLLGDGN